MRISSNFENLAATLPSENLRRELRSLARAPEEELRHEGLLHLAARLESRGQDAAAAEIYASLLSDSTSSPIQERARLRLSVLSGEGPVGDRMERGFGRFVAEVSDPASLAAMAVGGLAFRTTRLAVLGRLMASPSSLMTRGWGARGLASIAGFAFEAPLFTLSSKLGHQALGRTQEWGGAGLSREIAASYLFLGALRLSGTVASSAYRRVGGVQGSAWQGIFTQAGMFTGILGAHALEVQAGLTQRRDRASVLADSLVLLLQFNVAGRLSQHLIGENGRNFERELDLRAASLSRPVLVMPNLAEAIPNQPLWAMMGPEVDIVEGSSRNPGGTRLPVEGTVPEAPVSASNRPARPEVAERLRERGAGSGQAPSADAALRRLLRESSPLEETAKREVIRRVQGGDRAAKAELLRSDVRWVYTLARRYGFRGPELLDALQEGQMGLLDAAGRFDFRDVKFATYATWWVRSYLGAYAAKYLQEVRIPAHQLDMMRHLRNELQELNAGGQEVDAAELAQRLEITPQRLEELKGLERSRFVDSMDMKRGSSDDGYDLHETLPDRQPLADQQLIGRRLRSLIDNFIARRPTESDRFLLQNRLFDGAELGHGEIAERLGSTAGQVKNREARLLYQLRVHLESHGVSLSGAEPLRHAAFYREPKIAASTPSEVATALRPSLSQASLTMVELASLRPRIAIVGFGMAGVGAANALRNFRLFSDETRDFRPQITVFEGMNRVGGKVAPDNLGAQFVDASHFYPIDRLIQEHRLPTTPLRGDYDLATFNSPSGTTLSGLQFSQALRILRQSAREALRSRDWEELDQQSAADFIQYLGRRNGPLAPEEVGAMISRLGFEEGTLNVSALSFAVNLAKSETPMPRYGILGGLHRLVEAERGAVLAAGGQVHLGRPVRGVQAMADGVRLLFNEANASREESFDYAILALAPEHLKGFEVSGSELPIDALTRLEPSHIRKTNLRSHLLPPTEESANPRFARWNSPDPLNPRLPMVTFFHGWNGEKALTLREMMREAYGRDDAEAMLQVVEQNWDGRPQDGIPHYYTTMPQPGAGYAVARFAMDQYFLGRYDAERLRVANHTLGLGCYIRDGALSGELAALSLLRGAGLNVGRAEASRLDSIRGLLGADKIR